MEEEEEEEEEGRFYISDIIVRSTPSRELIGDINCKIQTQGWQSVFRYVD